jgi:hypothetical protein
MQRKIKENYCLECGGHTVDKLLRVIEKLIEQRDEAIAFHCYLDKYAEQVLESHMDSKRMYNLEIEELIK